MMPKDVIDAIYILQMLSKARHGGAPVIPATQKAEILRILISEQPEEEVSKTLSQPRSQSVVMDL
jgi:hypothetical protein